MFSDLMLLNKERTAKQAVGFYLAFVLISMLVGGLTAVLVGGFSASHEEGVLIGGYSAVIFCLILSFTVLYQKGRLHQYGLVLLALLSGIGAALWGSMLGLIFTAYLTTIEIKNFDLQDNTLE